MDPILLSLHFSHITTKPQLHTHILLPTVHNPLMPNPGPTLYRLLHRAIYPIQQALPGAWRGACGPLGGKQVVNTDLTLRSVYTTWAYRRLPAIPLHHYLNCRKGTHGTVQQNYRTRPQALVGLQAPTGPVSPLGPSSLHLGPTLAYLRAIHRPCLRG